MFAKIQGFNVSSASPGAEQILKWDGSNWQPVSNVGIVPIGTVLPWLKSFPGPGLPPITPPLPPEFVECNGQILNDPTSIYNAQTIPDLNNDQRFLRGNPTSGTIGGSVITSGPSSTALFVNVGVGSDFCCPQIAHTQY